MIEKIKYHVPRILLEDPIMRRSIFDLRRIYYCHVRRKLRTMESPDSYPATVEYNLPSLKVANPRMLKLVRPLSIIETMNRDSKILVIGPRNEHDLLLLVANGFRWENLEGIDLISYSPKIRLSDMHAMPYADGTWDAVLSGWTLAYSHAPEKAAQEMLRVTKDGGLIGLAIDYTTMTQEDQEKLGGIAIYDRDLLPDDKRVNSVQQILKLFEPHVDKVYFQNDAPNRVSSSASGIANNTSFNGVIFSVKKRP